MTKAFSDGARQGAIRRTERITATLLSVALHLSPGSGLQRTSTRVHFAASRRWRRCAILRRHHGAEAGAV